MKNTLTLLLLTICSFLKVNHSAAQSWFKHFGEGNAQQTFLTGDGNYLIWAKENSNTWVPESFFLKIAPNGDFIERIDFPGRGFSAIKQNADGTFDALGTLPIALSQNNPYWFHLSGNMEVLDEVNLGLDSVEINGNPYPTIIMENGLFHANGDFTMLLKVSGPGVTLTSTRYNSNKQQLWLNVDGLSESLSYNLKEDYNGNYLITGVGAVMSVGALDNDWNTIWGKTYSFINDALPLPNGNTLVMTITGGFNNIKILNNLGLEISAPTTTYPAYDYGGLVNSTDEIILTGLLVDTNIVSSGSHIRAIDINGNDLWNYWLSFDNDKFRTVKELPNGGYLVMGNTQISLPNQPVKNGDIILARTLPSGQLYAGQVQGVVTVEPDADCNMVFSDPEFPNFKIMAQGVNNLGAVSANNGTYILPLNLDDYTVSLVPPSPFWEVCENDVVVELTSGNPVASIPFLVHASSVCPYPEVSLTSNWLRRCFDNQYSFSVRNFGSDTLANAELLLSLEPLMNFGTASWSIVSQNGNEVRLSVPPIPPFGWATGYFTFNLSCNAEIGQTHCIEASLQQLPTCLEVYPLFEALECRPNTSSYDPNDLNAFADGIFTGGAIYGGEELEYLIRFQNTGTDTAFRVVVETLLPDELDLPSLQAGASSHHYQTRLEGRLLKFIFEDIKLPDTTTNLDGSQGFVKFKIDMNDGLQIGETIACQAHIFFDYNAPITTNEVLLTLTESLSTKELPSTNLRLFPNPFKGKFSVQLPVTGEDYLLEVQNLMGQTVHSQTVGHDAIDVDGLQLSAGIYHVQLLKDGRPVLHTKAISAW